MAVNSFSYNLDIRDVTTGLPKTGLALVELRSGALSYAFTEVGNGIYRRLSIPAGRYDLYINSIASGQSYGVGEGELAGLGYVNGSFLISKPASIEWTPSNNYAPYAHLTDPNAHNEKFAAIEHNGLQGLNTGDLQHLSLEHKQELTSGVVTSLHKHYHDEMENIDVGEIQHITPDQKLLLGDGTYIDLPPVDPMAWKEGRIFYDQNTHTLTIYNDISNTSQQVGLETWIRVRNRSGAIIANGSVVYIDGATGQTPTIQKATCGVQKPTEIIGVVTADILDQGHGWATVLGVVNDLNTLSLTEGAPIYLSGTTAGELVSTKPAHGCAVQVGVCLYSHGTQGKILARISDATSYAFAEANTATKEQTGFINGSSIAVSYDSTARTVTITGDLSYLWRGEYKTLTSPWTSAAHGTSNGSWFLYSTDGINFAWSQTQWSFSDVQVAYTYYGVSDKFALRETHEATMDWAAHLHSHETQGTYKRSGGTFTAGTYAVTPSSPTNADNTPGIDETLLNDEDLQSTISALTQGSYTIAYGNASNQVVFSKASASIIPIGTTYIQYNNAGTLTELATGNFVNLYVVAMPSSNDAVSLPYRYLFVPGSSVYTSLAQAQAEPVSINLGNFASVSPEYVAISRLTLRTNAAYSSSGKFRIEYIQYLSGTRNQSAVVGGVGVTSHDQLSNVQGGTVGEQYHDTLAQHNQKVNAGSANGYATLDSSGRLPSGQLTVHNHVLADISNMSAFMRTVNDDATAADARATLEASPLNTTLTDSAGSNTLPTTASGTLVSKIQETRNFIKGLDARKQDLTTISSQSGGWHELGYIDLASGSQGRVFGNISVVGRGACDTMQFAITRAAATQTLEVQEFSAFGSGTLPAVGWEVLGDGTTIRVRWFVFVGTNHAAQVGYIVGSSLGAVASMTTQTFIGAALPSITYVANSAAFGGIVASGDITANGLTASRALVSDANKKVTASATTSAELGYLSGVTSAVQTQLNKATASGKWEVREVGGGGVGAEFYYDGNRVGYTGTGAGALWYVNTPSVGTDDSSVATTEFVNDAFRPTTTGANITGSGTITPVNGQARAVATDGTTQTISNSPAVGTVSWLYYTPASCTTGTLTIAYTDIFGVSRSTQKTATSGTAGIPHVIKLTRALSGWIVNWES